MGSLPLPLPCVTECVHAGSAGRQGGSESGRKQVVAIGLGDGGGLGCWANRASVLPNRLRFLFFAQRGLD